MAKTNRPQVMYLHKTGSSSKGSIENMSKTAPAPSSVYVGLKGRSRLAPSDLIADLWPHMEAASLKSEVWLSHRSAGVTSATGSSLAHGPMTNARDRSDWGPSATIRLAWGFFLASTASIGGASSHDVPQSVLRLIAPPADSSAAQWPFSPHLSEGQEVQPAGSDRVAPRASLPLAWMDG